MVQSLRILSCAPLMGCGATAVLSATGTKANEIRIETTANKAKPSGSARVSSAWPTSSAEKSTIRYTARMRPRFSDGARSLIQLSMIMFKPAMHRPVITRSAIHQMGSTNRACPRAAADATDASAVKVRMWPTFLTNTGVSLQPAMKPTKNEDSSRPMAVREKPSRLPRTASNVV